MVRIVNDDDVRFLQSIKLDAPGSKRLANVSAYIRDTKVHYGRNLLSYWQSDIAHHIFMRQCMEQNQFMFDAAGLASERQTAAKLAEYLDPDFLARINAIKVKVVCIPSIIDGLDQYSCRIVEPKAVATAPVEFDLY
jgi:hypothetical protein